jgi:acetamidase/formamidase
MVPARHQVDFSRETVHGSFDRDRLPILTIASGDTVVYRTLDAGWGFSENREGDKGRGFERDGDEDDGHALSGPIAVEGAQPGDVLEIEIGEIRPGWYGWTWAGPRPWMQKFGARVTDEVRVDWRLDPQAGTATDSTGKFTVPIRPFMGVMGNAPADPGRHSTGPPRRVGGNLDCRELVTGTTLWLPIDVEGALFSVGDGHAAQADGEASSTAIECPMERVELTFRLRTDMRVNAPRAETPAGYLTLGLGDTLDDAADMALNEMLDHLQTKHDLDRPTALAIASLAVDLRITQVVNGTMGVHAVLAPDAFVYRSE